MMQQPDNSILRVATSGVFPFFPLQVVIDVAGGGPYLDYEKDKRDRKDERHNRANDDPSRVIKDAQELAHNAPFPVRVLTTPFYPSWRGGE